MCVYAGGGQLIPPGHVTCQQVVCTMNAHMHKTVLRVIDMHTQSVLKTAYLQQAPKLTVLQQCIPLGIQPVVTAFHVSSRGICCQSVTQIPQQLRQHELHAAQLAKVPAVAPDSNVCTTIWQA